MIKENVLDEEGFVTDPSLWTDELSRKMAEEQFNLVLTELHIQTIRFVREYYLKWETVPMMKTIREHFKMESEQLDEMFKRGKSSSRGVICKLGGLPKMLCIASGC